MLDILRIDHKIISSKRLKIMLSNISNFERNAISHVLRGVYQIKTPTISGTQRNVFFVKTSEGDFVAKFGCRDIVFKNCFVAHLASRHGIFVPDISMAEYKGQWIEIYPMFPEKTLFEHIREGMSEKTVRLAFENMLTQFVRMGSIQVPKNQQENKSLHIHNSTYEHTKNTNGTAMAMTLRPIVYMLNRGRDRNIGLYHSDMTTKNVIVNEKGSIVSIIDLDSMAICNRDYAFGAMADKWCELGFNLHELYDKYEYLADQPINRMRINSMLRTIHLGKYLMFKANKHRQK